MRLSFALLLLLVLLPAQAAGAATVPASTADAAFVERDSAVPTPAGPLPATLTLPRGAGPFPALVLVHGSGPGDRDESFGGTRPFRDLAHGLAAHGIAVLRYEKRTRAYPLAFAGGRFDVDDETTDDAVAAIDVLAHAPGIDAHRVFVLGHSQGGLLAPRIATRSGKVAGAVLWAAPARPLLTLLREQAEARLRERDGTLTDEDNAQLAALDVQIARVRQPGAEVPASESPLGAPAAYLRSVEAVDARADALALPLPLLLLQGGRDIQVTQADWALWQQALSGQPHATLRHYPALNHLGVAGSGPGTVAEYFQPGHVDAAMIDDIAHWILSQPPR